MDTPQANVDTLGEASAAGDTRVFMAADPRGADEGEGSGELDDEAIEPGARVGRYMIIDVIGSGGVGVVFAAYDPDLDRKVAIKQLRRSKSAGNSDAVLARRSRLQREAQALARLSHPNVVPVYEVTTYAEQLHVVMEFVEGQTLGEWLGQAPRGWAEIVAMFVQTGRGLAAAHAANIVHRDFKPENVRVGSDGRPRVLDFGLATPLLDGELEHAGESVQGLIERSFEEDVSWSESSDGAGDPVVTREGQVMGTPAYMAPEQASAGQVNARSDQFSFCVALYEALYGRRPFRGRFDNPRRFRDLSRARKLPGKRPPDLPIEVERVLLRGLSISPERRFEDMQALLGELSAVATGSRRLWWVPISIMLLALVAVVAFYERRATPPTIRCEDDASLLEGVWDPGIVEELRVASMASGKSYALGVWTRAHTNFEAWSEQWSRARVRACEATHVKGEQSPELLERRVACLDRQLVQVESMVSSLRRQQPEADALLATLEALELPKVDSCAAASLLDHASLDPAEPERRARGEAIRARLAEVEGYTAVGEYTRAVQRGQLALDQAEALGFEAIRAEALLVLARTVELQHQDPQRAAALLREAVWAGQRTGHDVVLIRAAATLAVLTATDQAELEVGAVWGELARATFEHHGEDPRIEAEVRRKLGELALAQGNYDVALREYQRALEFAREQDGERSLAYINALRSIGTIETELGRFAEAVVSLERARLLATTTLGARHPVLPELLDALGSAQLGQGKFDEALELHRAARELNEEFYGVDHPRVATSLNNLAIIFDETGRYADSLATLERARTILAKNLGADHPNLAYVDVNLGSALQNLGRNDEALERYLAALSVLEDSLGPAHMSVGVTLQNLGSARSALGDELGALDDYERSATVLAAALGERHPAIASLDQNRAKALRSLDRNDEALAAGARALDIFEEVHGPTHHELVVVLTELARIELVLGDVARSLVFAQRAVSVGEVGKNAPSEFAAAHLLLADILLDEHDDRARAQATIEACLRALEASDANLEVRAELVAWLDTHEKGALAGPD